MTNSDDNHLCKDVHTQPTILAIETSTAACSVAVRYGGEIHVLSETGSTVHSQEVLPQIEKLLCLANCRVQDLDAVAIGQGPGSFTGLRIGIGVAQGISYGANCPMIGVSSLAVLAMSIQHDGLIAVGTDARMGELYFAEYRKQSNRLDLIGQEVVCAPQDLRCESDRLLVGNAWTEYWHKFDVDITECRDCPPPRLPSAGDLLILAEQDYELERFIDAKDFKPVYVRNNVAKKTVDR